MDELDERLMVINVKGSNLVAECCSDPERKLEGSIPSLWRDSMERGRVVASCESCYAQHIVYHSFLNIFYQGPLSANEESLRETR